MERSVRGDTGSLKAASCATGMMPSSRKMAAIRAGSTVSWAMPPAAAATPEAYQTVPLVSFRVTTPYSTPRAFSCCAAVRIAASSARSVRSTCAQLPPVIAIPSSCFSSGASGVWDSAASEDAAAEAAADAAASASRSRSFTTVYHVWVAQSST